jgi:thymidylate kinase
MSRAARRAAELLGALDRQGIRYAVVGSAREDIGRSDEDIDLLTDPAALAGLAGPLARACRDTGGWLVNAIDHQPNACCFVCVWLDAACGLTCLQLDFAGALRRRGRLLLAADHLLDARQRAAGSPATGGGFYVAAPADAFIYSLLKGITKPRLPEADAARLSREWRDDAAGARARIAQYWPGPEGELLAGAAQRDQWDGVRAAQSHLRRVLVARRPRVPGLAALEIARVARRIARPTGLVVAFLGPDGSGKSTLIERVAPALAPVFRRQRRYHFRPDPFGLGLPTPSAGATPTGRQPAPSLVSWAKLAYYLIDYWVGYVRSVWPLKVRTGLAVFDRYFHDLAIDPIRLRRRGPMAVARLLERLVPAPDLSILVHAPTWTIQARKQDVPPHETERQRRAYVGLIGRLPRAHVVDGTRPVADVTRQVLEVILAYLGQRAAGRLGLVATGGAGYESEPALTLSAPRPVSKRRSGADARTIPVQYPIAAAARPKTIQSDRN